MRIIINDNIANNSDELLLDPAISGAAEVWGSEGIYDKSSIPLQLFLTPFGSISLLYGPRQIGKTSSLKIFLHQLKDSDSIIVTDCSVILNKEDLYKHLKGRIAGASTIVLDEVQAVADWHLALRALYNEGSLKQVRLWCTGSEARYLLESGERLPGRKGAGRNIFARPWSFREYLEITQPQACEPYRNIKLKHVTQDWLHAQDVEWTAYWTSYLNSGGFPRPLGERLKSKRICDETFRVYEDWILGAWTKLRTPERSQRAFLSRLVASLNSRTSFDALTKGTDIASPNTARSLLEILEDHFAIRTMTKFDVDERRFKLAKQKKFYPVDSFIAEVMAATGTNIKRHFQENRQDLPLDETAFFAQFMRREGELEVGYLYSDQTKSEIDFFAAGIAFELKTRGYPTNNQLKLLRQADQAFIVQQERLPLMAYLVGESRDSVSGLEI